MKSYKEKTRESYNKHARDFADYFKGKVDISRRSEFGMFLKKLGRGKKVLDLGCGGGDHSVWFKENGLDVVAIDLSEEMIKLAKKKGVDARVMDLEDLDFGNNEFDGIWAITSLLHVPKNKLKDVVKKLFEILKPGGILFVEMKEGTGQGYIEDKSDSGNRWFLEGSDTKRFFVFYEKNEFLSYVQDYFELIDYWEQKPRSTNFLHFMLKSRKLT